ncbi:PAS domain-containing sensor histidine kinase [Polynucleobacter sphagniphilus]|jgi:PAS domain S-box-containing protein|uniref:PAS domain-containing sensor histidine kinase n=1 Tax=Polynucleobacter sphagniphilus TaxID=1743169 RepID=UPI002406961D|nr:PAS domain-containing sensor histidine kinase [Polynucleobacter sphagniphilus]MDF9788020.1 PAS domain S-box-containing protein [Polynucleobacter sphagniphilus]MDH6249516.1 PAS domain S-box-containing protein [Polynucleobacter sphagniphilus]MDH6299392.1 PAS domain S-box-containing protein [Polynucleobacter sphagniphilus]MDH6523780.1 PAS domain S-box-containing protein [Polynucleobacter sphagniphilus]
MKLIAVSIKKLGPFKWLRKIRGFKLVYTPLIAIILFTAVMGIILGTLQLQERSQQESALFRELSFAKQRIQLRFANNTETLISIARESAKNDESEKLKKETFVQVESFLNSNHEIIQVIWLNENKVRQWSLPHSSGKNELLNQLGSAPTITQELNKAVDLSKATNRPAYSQFIFLNHPIDGVNSRERNNVFWQAIPASLAGESAGTLAVLYSAQGLLDVIPAELKSLYRFTLLADNEKVIAISSDKNTPKRALSNQTNLDMGVLSPNLTLRIDTYPPPTNLTFRMLIGVVLGLSAFVIWSLWSVLKQMQVRQKVEADLRSETNFRNAMENSTPVGIRAHDMEKNITYVNRAFCEMTGWRHEELIGLKPPFPFWPQDRLTQITDNWNRALQSNLGLQGKRGIEGIILRKDGAQIQTRTFVAPLIDEKGIQTGWVTSLIDISEPKKIREELAASQDRFVTVLEGLEAAVSVVSIDTGELLFANRFYRERFGDNSKGHFDLAGGEVVHNTMSQIAEDSNDANPGIPPSSLYQESESEEILISEPTRKWYEVRRRFVPWVDGHMAQLLIATDITIRKDADELSRQQEEKMQFTSRLTTMGEMASSLAHELNQPLSAISNYCMGVSKRLKGQIDPDLNNEIQPALEKASAQALRAGTIIQRIRGFVKRSEPQRKSCNIGEIINDAVGLVEIEAHRHRLSIASSIEDNLPDVDLDPVLILQVLVNLLKNGLDSMREAYPLSSRWSAPPVKISANLDTSAFPAMIRIEVTDSGSGIAEAVVERMFEPFFSTKSDGMGMGLNICRSIIESHQGRLWAKNIMDPEHTKLSGCTFTILLPLESLDISGSA